ATPQALAPAAAAYEQESLPLSQPPAFLRTARQQRETVPAPHYEPQYAELQHSEPQYQAHDVPYREPHAEALAAPAH
ncbi:hypothetical protein, partial [Pseudomonas sp. AH2 (2023)]|uniref:hypothetical protein n=1 Tax=Pseudomonas sp. AH2 (2023) TaxID=3048599 RepID=UPI002B232534